MGTCGCGDTDIHYLLPAPDDTVYGLEFYHGCNYCGSGPALTLHCFGDLEEAEKWAVGGEELDLPSRLPKDEDYQYVCDHIPVLDNAKLDEAIEEQYDYLGDSYTDEMRQMGEGVLKEIIKAVVRSWSGLTTFSELRLRRERREAFTEEEGDE